VRGTVELGGAGLLTKSGGGGAWRRRDLGSMVNWRLRPREEAAGPRVGTETSPIILSGRD